MVQTRRKTAAAAQDGAVKENKAGTPAPQTPAKKGKRGRPPKVKNVEQVHTINSPSTSAADYSSLEKMEEQNGMTGAGVQDNCGTNPDETAEVVSAKNDIGEQTSSILSSEEPSSGIPSLPSFIRRSTVRLKSVEIEDVREKEKSDQQEEILSKKFKKTSEPTSPVHPDDPQPSTVSPVGKIMLEVNGPTGSITSHSPISTSISHLKFEENLESNSLEHDVFPKSKQSSNNEESESMDIANSESEGENDNESVDEVLNISNSSIPLPDSDPPLSAHRSEIHVDVDHKFSNNSIGWDRKNEKVTPSPLSSPTMGRPIHFLHPAYSSFANASACISPQPPEPAPVKEKNENGVSGVFKMTFKKGTTNALLKTSALEKRTAQQTSNLNSSSSSSSLSEVVPSGVETTPTKRSSNFGTTSASELPPPQMVELPKLSFNTPAPTISVFSSESDASEDQVSPKSVPFTTPSKKHTDSEIQALIAKAGKVAQSIERRYEEDRQKDGRDDYDRRREDRDRRSKKPDSERNDQQSSKVRQREDDERRAREREREVTKRHDREREEERNQRQKEEEKRKRDDEEQRRKVEEEKKLKEENEARKEEERKLKEEEKKAKEEEEKMKQEEMKIPKYEPITECIFKMKNANRKKTESLQCDCSETDDCSDSHCVNRAMMTECPSSCRANKCKNQRFAKKKYAAVEPFHTGTPKGCGLRAVKDIKAGKFIIEYIGEVLEREDYEKRKIKYAANKKHKHHYLCDTGVYTIDATEFGNPSRFVNHSCDPNAVCEKWSVPKTPGDISRIGFFAKRFIKAGEEICFDYQFVNYGRDAQPCFCGTAQCNRWIGRQPEELSSSDDDDDDDSDIITSRDINLDEEEEEKLEELNGLEHHEKIELIEEMLDELVIKNKKHAKKVITIATRITDHGQRKDLLKKIFSTDTSLVNQAFYAQNGMATLMGEWLEADDYSLVNLKLVQVILQTLHADVFVPCAKADSFLLEVLSRWMNSSLGDWVDLHVVANSLITCTEDPSKEYNEVAIETQKDIIENFKRVKDMASRLNHHWFNRSVSFRIPKKVRVPDVKESVNRQEQASQSSSQPRVNERSSPASPVSQRQHTSSYSNSYYNDRDSHPRFFNNGNDVHQYRFTGYHGNNYKVNYGSRKDSYRDRRRYGSRRSRSRSRSSSPQNHKRRRYDERENHRGRTPPYERRPTTPDQKIPESHKSGERVYEKPEVRGGPRVRSTSEEAEVTATHDYTQEHPHVHPVSYPVPYQYAGYENHYMYPNLNSGYLVPIHPSSLQPSMDSFPSLERLQELYRGASLEELKNRLHAVQEEVNILTGEITVKRVENERMEAARFKAEQEEALKTIKYAWGKAKAPEGEIYYYHKITKETQWTPPTADQGLLEPDAPEVCDDSIASQETKVPKTEIQDSYSITVKEEFFDPEMQSDTRNHSSKLQNSTTSASYHSKSSSPKSNRDKREGSRHRDHAKNGYRESTSSDSRVKKYKSELEQCIKSVVNTHHRLMTSHEITSDKITWLIKLIAKEMFKRESSQNGFDFRLTENTEKKVKNYTRSLIERKLDSNDLWKGYSGR